MQNLIAIAVLLLITLPSGSPAQLLVGALGGANLTGISGDAPPGTSYSGQVGYVASAVVDIPLGDDIWLSLQPGYSRVGTRISVTSAIRPPKDTLDVSMEYFVLPVLGRVLARNGVTYATGGVQAAVLTSAGATPTAAGQKKDLSGAVAGLDLAIIIGAGVQIPFSSSVATLELRYAQSLLNAGKTEAAAEAFQMPPRFRLSGFQLIAGVLFSL